MDTLFYKEAVQIVEAHLARKDFTVGELAFLMGMNRVTLHRRMKSVMHKPAGAFIREIRLEHAAGFLSSGEFKVCEAARHSGFFNLSYFSKCFKERYGVKPSEYLGENPRHQIPNPNQMQKFKIHKTFGI